MCMLAGHKLVRINLSEQTDIMDLLGADLPSASGRAGEFAWSDGPLLAALKAGDWVLLDELNLASQSVLEGLNAMLDHRGEIFIAELCRTFQAPTSFRIFGAQNPIQEGGGRRGLPKSFLNRFTKVFVDILQPSDLAFVAGVPSHLSILSIWLPLFLSCFAAMCCHWHFTTSSVKSRIWW